MGESNSRDFTVKRTKLSEARWAPARTRLDRQLAEGEALLRVDRFAFTANNITYALTGELAQYWEFFPAEPGWGRIPVWGYATVVASRVSRLPEGQRVYGYLPMSTLLKVQAGQLTQSSFTDASEHRRHLPAFYQSYTLMQHQDPRDEHMCALLMGLTGWLIDAWLIENELFGAQQMVLGSASSKTALCTAFMLGRRAGRAFQLIGLTSARNRAFCERTGYYDRVVEYADVHSLPAQTPTVLVDMSGSTPIRRSVHEHFRAALRFSSAVGITHGTLPVVGSLPDMVPQLFVASAQLEKRQYQYGAAGLDARFREAWAAYDASARTWLEVVRARGHAAIEAAYHRVLSGQVAPQELLILSF
jgi:hypothetical protein